MLLSTKECNQRDPTINLRAAGPMDNMIILFPFPGPNEEIQTGPDNPPTGGMKTNVLDCKSTQRDRMSNQRILQLRSILKSLPTLESFRSRPDTRRGNQCIAFTGQDMINFLLSNQKIQWYWMSQVKVSNHLFNPKTSFLQGKMEPIEL